MSVRMKMNIYGCLLAFVLGCNAEIIHKTVKEKESITLPCPCRVEGKMTWSRDRNGHRVDILIVDGDRDIRLINYPYRRYSSLADKSLHIFRAGVSDTAKYFCNNEPAAELTVTPLGTTRLQQPDDSGRHHWDGKPAASLNEDEQKKQKHGEKKNVKSSSGM